MSPLFFVLPLVPVIVVMVVVYAVLGWRRRDGEPDPGIGTVRRLYFYTVSFVALMMAAIGVSLALEHILEALFGPAVLSRSAAALAGGLALTVVGAPLWALHWWLTQRYVNDIPVERRSLIRKLYVYLVLVVAVAGFLHALVGLVQWLFGSQPFVEFGWSAVIVWAAVWAFHWRLESSEGQPTAEVLSIRRLYLYLVSLGTLVMASVGFGVVVLIVLIEGYESLVSVPVLLPAEGGLWQDSVRNALAVGLVGGAGWAVHWLYFAREDYASTLRQVYLYIFTILAGVVTVLVSTGIVLHGVIAWRLGVPGDATAGAHFRFLPGPLTSLFIGVAMWAYHWTVVRREASVSLLESEGARRSYAYILAALGLGALVVAIGAVVNTGVTVVTERSAELLVGDDLWREPVTLVITLGLLGGPLWGYYWRTIQGSVSSRGAEERNATARRIYIFAVLGVGMLALLGSVSALLFFGLRDLLAEDLSLETLRDARPVIAIIAPAVIFLPYHWMTYQRERRAEPEFPVPEMRRIRKGVSVLVAEAGPLVRNLEAALGYRVEVLTWADPDAVQAELGDADLQSLVQRITTSEGRRVLLIPEAAGVRVISHD